MKLRPEEITSILKSQIENFEVEVEVEEVGTVLGVVKGVGHGLINRHGDGFGRGVGRVASVDSQGFNLHGVALSCQRGRILDA